MAKKPALPTNRDYYEFAGHGSDAAATALFFFEFLSHLETPVDAAIVKPLTDQVEKIRAKQREVQELEVELEEVGHRMALELNKVITRKQVHEARKAMNGG